MATGDASGDLLTSSEVARELGVSRTTVWRIPRRDLPYRLTPGGWRRYARSNVTAYRDGLAKR